MKDESLEKLIKNKLSKFTKEEQQNVKEYIIKNRPTEEDKKEYIYMGTQEYEDASDFISLLNYNYFYMPEYNGIYQGIRQHCRNCKNFLNTGCEDYAECKILKEKYKDINIKIHFSNDVCRYFDKHIESKYKNENIQDIGFDNYLDFLNREYYIDYKGDSTVYLKHNYIKINEYSLHIPLNDNWWDLNIINNNKIKYKEIYMTKWNSRSKKHKDLPKGIEKYHNEVDIDKLAIN